MTNKKNKKTARQKRTLVLALLVAATIAAGSTFAWFTSKDEVTNRLSAKADYGVTITEDFTPPEDWTPGQTIKKEAGAINTGNVDAFVRMWLTGEMKLIDGGDGIVYTSFPASLDEVTGEPYTGLKLTKKSGANYFRVLTDDERKALQTGELAYAGAAYTYTKNQLDDGADYGDGTAYTTGKGTVKLVDSDSFTPSAAGLYLFRRNYDLAANGDVDASTAQFSGYYFDGTNYYALKTANNSTVAGGVENAAKNVYVAELAGKSGDAFDTALATVKVYTAADKTITNDQFTWTYTEPTTAGDSPFASTNPFFTVTETGGSATFKINIELANIGNGTVADQWQHLKSAGGLDTFYYTDDVEAGETTNILVKNVQLDKGATQEDFLAFDFDLNVDLESIQVTKDDAGNETVVAVSGDNWAATTGSGITGATGSGTAAEDLALVTWVAK
jgi:predicted ribosomally synthesized peptide with SipW-like signal peptide